MVLKCVKKVKNATKSKNASSSNGNRPQHLPALPLVKTPTVRTALDTVIDSHYEALDMYAWSEAANRLIANAQDERTRLNLQQLLVGKETGKVTIEDAPRLKMRVHQSLFKLQTESPYFHEKRRENFTGAELNFEQKTRMGIKEKNSSSSTRRTFQSPNAITKVEQSRRCDKKEEGSIRHSNLSVSSDFNKNNRKSPNSGEETQGCLCGLW
mmetsp:Transcript_15081/g.22216  ORF Transcript_15081/g.22216 Transcript_15081/m.22216 type:complete len:211 (-) Transcript_15081:54-686(-)